MYTHTQIILNFKQTLIVLIKCTGETKTIKIMKGSPEYLIKNN